MCGICGVVEQGAASSKDHLIEMANAMAHRGPDDSGFYRGPGGIGLGHRRLSIIDLSPLGRQPMANEAETIQSVTNGEIYNFAELRTELEGRGHRFRGQCDAEVVPHAYEEWGRDFPTKLRGMFALAVWDAERERLLLVRDRVGIKPLYYYHRDGTLFFSSELKGLLAHPSFPREIDPTALYYYLAFSYVPAPLTIFKDTFKLQPGHTLSFDASGLSAEPYWSHLDAAAEPAWKEDEAELLERLDGLLRESMRYRMISDVPLGAFLSGGVDSSLTVALMREIATGPVKTFTIGFWEKKYDEAAHAAKIARHLETEHTELYVKPEDALNVIPKLPDVYDEPFGDLSAIPTYLVSKLARESVTVALSGDGGDELFCGYPRYYWSHLARPLDLLPQGVRRLLAPAVARLNKSKARRVASWLDYDELDELYRGVVGIWDKGALGEVLGFDVPHGEIDFGKIFRQTAGRPFLERLMLTDIATYMPEKILAKVDRASMAHSLEVRVPILDHHVVEMAMRVPLSMKFKRRQGKYLLRELLSRYLPRELYERPKMGFSVPLEHWFRNELRDLLRDYTNPRRLEAEGYLASAPIQRMVNEHLDGQRNHKNALWAIVMFEMWHERHLS